MKYSSVLPFTQPVKFNPELPSHLEAYAALLEGKQGDLRFELEFPHHNVLALMERRISIHVASQVTGKVAVDVSALPFYQRICYAA